jgi:SAM-dependent methyltransferase
MLVQRICATCGNEGYVVRYEARVPPEDALNFSARRASSRYHARIVECRRCGQIYSNPYFSEDVLGRLYREALYIDEPQLANMAADYFREFQQAFDGVVDPSRRVLEIGCGNGFFLAKLGAAGYADVWGVEPGRRAVEQAPASVRDRILCDFFRPGLFPAGHFDAVCCFQIFDHLPDPNAFLDGVREVLRKGGVIVAINHDIRAPVTRMLGERSPMFDIEHIYLFDKKTVRRLLANHGFAVERVSNLWSSYTVEYALKMLPLTNGLRSAAINSARALGLGSLTFRVPGGNMVSVARRID